MKAFRFTSAALSELREATLYYEERENGLGRICCRRLIDKDGVHFFGAPYR